MPGECSGMGAFLGNSRIPNTHPPAPGTRGDVSQVLSINLCEAWWAGAVLTAGRGSPQTWSWLCGYLGVYAGQMQS